MPHSYTAFDGHTRLTTATLADAAVALAVAGERDARGPLLIFDDATGRVVDVDTRGAPAEVASRYDARNAAPVEPEPTPTPRGPGRPRLGVVAREVTLLPHHWEWLAAQPGGASVTLRKLVEHARKAGAADERVRAAQERAYRFLHALAGDLPDYEEVTRALFRGDRARLQSLMASWPGDVAAHALRLLGDGEADAE